MKVFYFAAVLAFSSLVIAQTNAAKGGILWRVETGG